MRNLKFVLCLVVSVCIFQNSTLAQASSNMDEEFESRIEKLVEKLDNKLILSSNQETTIMTNLKKELMPMMHDFMELVNEDNKTSMLDKMLQMRHAVIRKELTPQQIGVYNAEF